MAKKFDKPELMAILQQLKDEHTGKGRSEMAQGIGQLISDLVSGKRDAAEVSIKGRIKLQKFAGVKNPGDIPVEVQEFITDI
jgi:hypothetical protein